MKEQQGLFFRSEVLKYQPHITKVLNDETNGPLYELNHLVRGVDVALYDVPYQFREYPLSLGKQEPKVINIRVRIVFVGDAALIA